MALQFLLLCILLAGSAFFSGAETALFSLSRYELSRFRRSTSMSSRLVAELMDHPRRLLLTLMIGNVTINMFIFAVSLSFFADLAGHHTLVGPLLGLMTPILLTVLGDILPKSAAISLRRTIAPAIAPVVRGVQIALQPVTFILLNLLVTPLTRLLTGVHPPDEYVTTEELGELIEVSEQHRVIDADENAMLGEIIQLSELKVYDVMVPRVDVVMFDMHDDPAELRRLIREHKLTRVPVYDASPDEIAGVVRAKDVFLNPAREPATLVQPVPFVPEMITLTQLIQHFRRTKTHQAIAVNEYGAVAGLVTIEDVATRIVGDLTVGESQDQPAWVKLDERHYRVSGSVSIRDWSEQFSFRGIDDLVTTLAGLMQARLGRLPFVGDQIHLGNLMLTVETLVGRRVEWILLELLDGHGDASNPAKPAKEGAP